MGARLDQAQPTVRHLSSDEQGVGLRATWRPGLGFVNLSLWRGQRCTETFRLTPVEAAKLVGFLASSLASAAPEPHLDTVLRAVPPLRAVGADASPPGADWTFLDIKERVRGRAADRLEELANRLRGG